MNIKMIKCSECGKHKIPCNRWDGLPTIIGFELEDGTIKNVCADCLIELGMVEERKKNGK